jgi:hypothetical protein
MPFLRVRHLLREPGLATASRALGAVRKGSKKRRRWLGDQIRIASHHHGGCLRQDDTPLARVRLPRQEPIRSKTR